MRAPGFSAEASVERLQTAWRFEGREIQHQGDQVVMPQIIALDPWEEVACRRGPFWVCMGLPSGVDLGCYLYLSYRCAGG